MLTREEEQFVVDSMEYVENVLDNKDDISKSLLEQITEIMEKIDRIVDVNSEIFILYDQVYWKLAKVKAKALLDDTARRELLSISVSRIYNKKTSKELLQELNALKERFNNSVFKELYDQELAAITERVNQERGW